MKLRLTPSTLEKIERVIAEAGYVLRYERGTFQSGFCILESRKVVVLNKFLQTEGSIITLIDLIGILQITPDHLSQESRKVYDDVIVKSEVAS